MAINVSPRLLRWLLILETLAVLGVLAFWYFGFGSARPQGDYQAVFLRGGQVYFGKLALNRHWATLTDIYYLQAAQSLQAGADQSPASQPNFQLIKLGTELHAPEDMMHIKSEDISFWENLTPGSRIIEAIAKYKASQ